MPERRGTEDGVSAVVIVRAPQLFDCLRAFCLGSFRALLQELERGAASPESDEELEVVRWASAEIAAKVGEIEDVKTLAGLLLYLRHSEVEDVHKVG